MNMCTFTRLRPVGIRIVDGCRADVQVSRGGGGGEAGGPYPVSWGGVGGVAGGPYPVQLLCA